MSTETKIDLTKSKEISLYLCNEYEDNKVYHIDLHKYGLPCDTPNMTCGGAPMPGDFNGKIKIINKTNNTKEFYGLIHYEYNVLAEIDTAK